MKERFVLFEMESREKKAITSCWIEDAYYYYSYPGTYTHPAYSEIRAFASRHDIEWILYASIHVLGKDDDEGAAIFGSTASRPRYQLIGFRINLNIEEMVSREREKDEQSVKKGTQFMITACPTSHANKKWCMHMDVW